MSGPDIVVPFIESEESLKRRSSHSFTEHLKDWCPDGVHRIGGPCPICKREFQTASGISNHMSTKHKGHPSFE